MFIETESTPNPCHAEVPARPRRDGVRARGFVAGEDATRSLLAHRLLELEWRGAVCSGRDFITVTKGDEGDCRRCGRRCWAW
jgi:hypothetical protein